MNNNHRAFEEYQRSRMNDVVVKSRITVSFDDTVGHTPFLTGVCPPAKRPHTDLWDLYKDISTADVKLLSTFSTDSPEYLTPYAVTFTYNADIMLDLVKDYNDPVTRQWSWFQYDFNAWLNLFKRRCKSVADGTYVACYEIYPELTKAGVLHAHGLIYINNRYPAIAHIMSKAWVDKTRKKGNSMLAMKKKNYRNSYDYAFAICNDVAKWRQYITKEHGDEIHCLQYDEPMDVDMEC